MQVKIYENHWLFKLPYIKEYTAITLAPYILVRDKIDEDTLFHENVHIQQIEKLGITRFYITYILWFVVNLLKYRNVIDAYSRIPFEEEAYRLTKEHFKK